MLTNWLTTSSLGTIGTWLLIGVDGAKGAVDVVLAVVVLVVVVDDADADADADAEAAAALAASKILLVVEVVLMPRIKLG